MYIFVYICRSTGESLFHRGRTSMEQLANFSDEVMEGQSNVKDGRGMGQMK